MCLLAQILYSHSRSCRTKKIQAASQQKKEPSKKILTQLAHIPIFFCQVRSSSRGEDLRDQRLGACPGT